MSASRLLRSGPLLAAGLLWAFLCGHAFGAAPPRLAGPADYAGELALGREHYRARLSLGPAGNFVLHEELLLPGGKTSGWEITGFWHQLRKDAFVQLSNASGLYRLLNVGGTGSLYLGMQFSNGEQHTVVLRPRPAAPPEVTLSGLLRPGDKETLLEDADSGLVYRVLPGAALRAFLDGGAFTEHSALPVRVRAEARPDAGRLPALRVRDIRSIPQETRRAARDPVAAFQEGVAGGIWQVTRLGNDAPPAVFRLRFIPGPERRSGRLECFDGARHLAGRYTLWNTELTLSVPGCAEPLAALLRHTRFWFLAGEALELRDEQGTPALLEQQR